MALNDTPVCSFGIDTKMRLSVVCNDHWRLKQSSIRFRSIIHRWGCWFLVGLLVQLVCGTNATAQQSASPLSSSTPGTVLSEPLPIPVGIHLDPGQREPASIQQHVVLIPGLLAGAESLQSVRRELQSRNVVTSTFHYTSAQGIAAAADLLSRELKRAYEIQPNAN